MTEDDQAELGKISEQLPTLIEGVQAERKAANDWRVSQRRLTKWHAFLAAVSSLSSVVSVIGLIVVVTLLFIVKDVVDPDGTYQKRAQANQTQVLNLVSCQIATDLIQIDVKASIANNSPPGVIAVRESALNENRRVIEQIIQNLDDVAHDRSPRNGTPSCAPLPEENP